MELYQKKKKKRIGKSDDVDFLDSAHSMEGSHMYLSLSFIEASVKKHLLHKSWKTEVPTVPSR